jgi:hypothetical protein
MLLALSQNRPAGTGNMPGERRLSQRMTERLPSDAGFPGHLGRRYLIRGGRHAPILLARLAPSVALCHRVFVLGQATRVPDRACLRLQRGPITDSSRDKRPSKSAIFCSWVWI